MERLPNEFKRHVNRANNAGEYWDLTKLLDLINDEIKVMQSTAVGNFTVLLHNHGTKGGEIKGRMLL